MTSIPPAPSSGPWTVYRLFAANGALLYIGHSRRPGARMAQHEAQDAWWPEVRSMSFETYPALKAARAAEAAAIRAEYPAHNKMRYRWQGPTAA